MVIFKPSAPRARPIVEDMVFMHPENPIGNWMNSKFHRVIALKSLQVNVKLNTAFE